MTVCLCSNVVKLRLDEAEEVSVSLTCLCGSSRKILNLRLREAVQQRLREAELERQRQAEGKDRLRNLNTIQEEVLQLNQLLQPSTQTKSDLPTANLSSYSARGNQLCSQVSEVVRKTAEVSLTPQL